MKIFLLIAMMVLSFKSQYSFAHGEDKPGPNGGFIRMPGAFHTEAIPDGSNKIKVYLLDINWQNPSVKDSSIKVTHKKSKTAVECAVESNYFVCQFPQKVNLNKKGEISVEATREGQKGMIVSYPLPLKLEKVDDGHGGHH